MDNPIAEDDSGLEVEPGFILFDADHSQADQDAQGQDTLPFFDEWIENEREIQPADTVAEAVADVAAIETERVVEYAAIETERVDDVAGHATSFHGFVSESETNKTKYSNNIEKIYILYNYPQPGTHSLTCKKLAQMFNLSISHVSGIIRNDRCTHITSQIKLRAEQGLRNNDPNILKQLRVEYGLQTDDLEQGDGGKPIVNGTEPTEEDNEILQVILRLDKEHHDSACSGAASATAVPVDTEPEALEFLHNAELEHLPARRYDKILSGAVSVDTETNPADKHWFPANIVKIYKMYNFPKGKRVSCKELADQFKCDSSTIWSIVNGKTHRDLTKHITSNDEAAACDEPAAKRARLEAVDED